MKAKTKKIIFLGMTMALTASFFLTACSKGKEVETVEKQKVVSLSQNQAEDKLLKTLYGKSYDGKNHEALRDKKKLLFETVDTKSLPKDKQKYVSIIKNVPGIHQDGDLLVLVGKKNETVKYFDEKLDGKQLTLYFTKTESKTTDQFFVVAKIPQNRNYIMKFYDVKTNRQISLEEERPVVKNEKILNKTIKK